MSISATYCDFDARAVMWGLWKSGVLSCGWSGRRRLPGERRRRWLGAPLAARGADAMRAIDEVEPASIEPVRRRCQARGCAAVFVTADIGEVRCPECRAARRKVPPFEASHCGCAAAMCAGV